MARKKGRDVSGWLLIDKPAGVGSTDVVGRVRWALDAKKAGHAGTLDPDATGLLAVALVMMVINGWDTAKFERYGPRYLNGLWTTISIVGISIVLGALLSLPIAFARMSFRV